MKGLGVTKIVGGISCEGVLDELGARHGFRGRSVRGVRDWLRFSCGVAHCEFGGG